jgi:hypothetical protein
MIGVKIFSGMIFTMYEDFFMGKKEKNVENLDDLIKARMLLMKKADPISTNKGEGGAKKPDLKLVEEATDPESKKRKEILHQIYDLDVKRFKDEADDTYYARILKLPAAFNQEAVKKAYKERAKACHPDRFDLKTFDEKTQKKLKAKIHENFLIIQKAYDHFKKAA